MPKRKAKRIYIKITKSMKDKQVEQMAASAVKYYESLGPEYQKLVIDKRITADEAAVGRIGELGMYIVRKFPMSKKKKITAINIITETRNIVRLSLRASTGRTYQKKDLVQRLNYALDHLEFVKNDLMDGTDRTRRLIGKLPNALKELSANPRKEINGNLRLINEIEMVNLYYLKRHLGSEAFDFYRKVYEKSLDQIRH